MQQATSGRRGMAVLLDLIALYLLHGGVLLYGLLAPDPIDRSVLLALVVLDVALVLAYGALEVLGGAAVGKRLLGLRIRSSAGAPASRRQLLLRWLFKYLPLAGGLGANLLLTVAIMNSNEPQETAMAASTVSGLLFILALVDILFAAGPSRQALHDRGADTVVADVRPTPA